MTTTALLFLSAIAIGSIAFVVKSRCIHSESEPDSDDNKASSKMKECLQCGCEYPQFYFTSHGICQHCNYQNTYKQSITEIPNAISIVEAKHPNIYSAKNENHHDTTPLTNAPTSQLPGDA